MQVAAVLNTAGQAEVLGNPCDRIFLFSARKALKSGGSTAGRESSGGGCYFALVIGIV